MSATALVSIVATVGVGAFLLVLTLRRWWPGVEHADAGSASAVLSYVAAAFGILVGFLIVV